MKTITRSELKQIINSECDKNTVEEVSNIRKLVLQTKNRMLLKEIVYGCRQIKQDEKLDKSQLQGPTLRDILNRKFEEFCYRENIK